MRLSRNLANWAITKSNKYYKAEIWQKEKTCPICMFPLTPANASIDHILPKSRGGKDNHSNLMALCKWCNYAKGSLTPEEWIQTKSYQQRIKLREHTESRILG